MSWQCAGCDNQIGWDGEGALSYTCQCGCHIFYNGETGSLAPPYSLVNAIYEKRELPHLDFLVGKSSFSSPLKEALIETLISLGAIWMKDCVRCLKDGAYQRMLDMEKADALLEAEVILFQKGG